MSRLLLISNSQSHGAGYLDHVEEEICSFLGRIPNVLFIPYALDRQDDYGRKFSRRMAAMGYGARSLHQTDHETHAMEQAAAIFTGGGNTFRLLHTLYEKRLIPVLRRLIEAGVPYIGTSAGSVIGGRSIKTTNDMPIVLPPSLASLDLVPFNLNCHYVDADPSSTHMGETRQLRIREFHEMNETMVVGLREGAYLRREADHLTLKGLHGGCLFVRGKEPRQLRPGTVLDHLLVT